VILYDANSSLTASKLKENIIQQNLDESSTEEEDIIRRFKTGPRNNSTVHWVMQVAPKVKKHILK